MDTSLEEAAIEKGEIIGKAIEHERVSQKLKDLKKIIDKTDNPEIKRQFDKLYEDYLTQN